MNLEKLWTVTKYTLAFAFIAAMTFAIILGANDARDINWTWHR